MTTTSSPHNGTGPARRSRPGAGRHHGGRTGVLPESERPRQRLTAVGVAHLNDRELLALVLGTGVRGTGVHTLAEQVLATYGSMPELARAHPADLATIDGIGPAKAAAIAAVFELARRLPRRKPSARPVIASDTDLHRHVYPLLAGRTRERLVLVVCNTRNQVTHTEIITEGTADRAVVPIREILTAILRHDADTFALAHNHPSGDPYPSDTDITATHKMHHAAHALGLRLLDHIVVTDHTWRRIDTTTATPHDEA